jgi:hypothetical protein
MAFAAIIISILALFVSPLIDYFRTRESIQVSIIEESDKIHVNSYAFSIGAPPENDVKFDITHLARWYRIKITNHGINKVFINNISFSPNGKNSREVSSIYKISPSPKSASDITPITTPIVLDQSEPLDIWVLLPIPISKALGHQIGRYFVNTNTNRSLNTENHPDTALDQLKTCLIALRDGVNDSAKKLISPSSIEMYLTNDLQISSANPFVFALVRNPPFDAASENYNPSEASRDPFKSAYDFEVCFGLQNQIISNMVSSSVLQPEFRDCYLEIETSRGKTFRHKLPQSQSALSLTGDIPEKSDPQSGNF